MDIYEKIKLWVEQTLGQSGYSLQIDQLRHTPEAAGLFPQGVQVLRQWEDVTGAGRRQVRYSFLLRLVVPPDARAADLLLRLQAQAAMAPPVPKFAAPDGKMKKVASDGLAIYEIRLTAEREEHL